MRNILILILVLLGLFGLYAQDESSAEYLPSLTASEALKEISVNKMEDAGFWKGEISSDFGLLQLRDFDGGSRNKEPIAAEEQSNIIEPDNKVIGVKVSFLRRGVTEFSIESARPLPIEGITKTVSVWVVGRNIGHELSLLITDGIGQRSVIPMGKINHSGWKKMTVTIPPHIKQRDYHYGYRTGISVVGFIVNCEIDETYGRYYIYLDDLRAVTDLFDEELLKDSDDMLDAW